MVDAIYQKNSDSQTSDIYHSSSLLVLHYKMSGREHPLTLRQRTKECSSVKMNEGLFFLSLMIDFSRIAQRILVQRPVRGTGVESLAPYFDSCIPFCTFDMQLGSMLTISKTDLSSPIYTGYHFTPCHRSTSFLEEVGI